jgi:2,4-dienoyl-CoA reductase-like NADH-dependent reductase (Old Yellow Enzyme family)
MSLLFSPVKIGRVEVNNRFVRSATNEGMATPSGEVTDRMIKVYQNLAKGGVGLIITGHLYVDALGRASNSQPAIDRDETMPGLKRLVDAVHQRGGKIVFQLSHSGRQTKKEVIGRIPMAPSSIHRDLINFQKPVEMSEKEIHSLIRAFALATQRAVEVGADGVQLHAGHGYLISQFLSPFFNQRSDEWGGSDENRFHFLKETAKEVKKALPEDKILLVKLNGNDHTPEDGVTPPLAVKYATWMESLGFDGIEVSCGNGAFAPFSVFRGEVPVEEMIKNFPWWKKTIARSKLQKMVGKYDLIDAYNLDTANQIKSAIKKIPIMLVGGLRKLSQMEEIVENGHADFISMSRPFIKEPFIVNIFKEKKRDMVKCISCNKCFAGSRNALPVLCYEKGLPQNK